MTGKQGIVAILGSEANRKTPLRRTLSADMSSKRWLMAQNDSTTTFPPPPLKRVASSEHIAKLVPDEGEDGVGVKSAVAHPRRVDVWNSILSQQSPAVALPPPYVHPLVKKSAGSLSKNSLEVCTESLGSETGSDVFSSPPSSENGDEKPQEVEEEEEARDSSDDGHPQPQPQPQPHGHPMTKKSQKARALPPPLASLAAARNDGPSLHMHSRRVDGRLVLEAVSVPSQKFFEAQRHDGRFLLTLINDGGGDNHPEAKEKDSDDMTSNSHDNDSRISKQQGHDSTVGSINPQRSTTLMAKKVTKRDNRNLSWSSNKAAAAQSLPPRPVTTRAAGLPPLPPSPPAINSYQYFWRAKPSVASVIDPLKTQHTPPTKNKDLVLMRGNKADCLLPSLKGCKEPRRSLLMWEPFCIATT